MKKSNLLIMLILFVNYSYSQKKEESDPLESVLKFDMMRMLTGEISFSYERSIGTNASLEFSLGPTISQLEPFNNTHVFNQNTKVNSGIGGFASVGLRYYPVRESLKGFYLSPIVKYRIKNSYYEGQNFGLDDQLAYNKLTSFVYNVGIQKWVNQNFFFDFYTGIGIGLKSNQTYYSSYNFEQNANEWIGKTDRSSTLILNLGVKMGVRL